MSMLLPCHFVGKFPGLSITASVQRSGACMLMCRPSFITLCRPRMCETHARLSEDLTIKTMTLGHIVLAGHMVAVLSRITLLQLKGAREL